MCCSLIALCSLASWAFFCASKRALSDSATSAFRITVVAYFFSSAAALASIYSNNSMWLMQGWLDAKNSSVLENDCKLNGFCSGFWSLIQSRRLNSDASPSSSVIIPLVAVEYFVSTNYL